MLLPNPLGYELVHGIRGASKSSENSASHEELELVGDFSQGVQHAPQLNANDLELKGGRH